jgi:hypothetical protein
MGMDGVKGGREVVPFTSGLVRIGWSVAYC